MIKNVKKFDIVHTTYYFFIKYLVMNICKKCGNVYKIPKNSIDIGLMRYCLDCIRDANRKIAKMSIRELIKLEAKKLING